jgi:hypothetical protein
MKNMQLRSGPRIYIKVQNQGELAFFFCKAKLARFVGLVHHMCRNKTADGLQKREKLKNNGGDPRLVALQWNGWRQWHKECSRPEATVRRCANWHCVNF